MEGNVSRDMKEGGHRVCVRSLLEACGFCLCVIKK